METMQSSQSLYPTNNSDFSYFSMQDSSIDPELYNRISSDSVYKSIKDDSVVQNEDDTETKNTKSNLTGGKTKKTLVKKTSTTSSTTPKKVGRPRKIKSS